MRKHHVPAVVLAAINIALLLVDIVARTTTGERTFITDDAKGNTMTALFMSVTLGVTLLAMAWVVRCESHRFAAARRPARITRPILMVGLIFLGVGFLTIQPLQILARIDSGTFYNVSGLVAFGSLVAVFLAALVLGLALLGRNPLGIGGTVLAGIGPAILLTVLLAVTAPVLAGTYYVTLVLLAGVSLLGVGAGGAAPRIRAEQVAPRSRVTG